MKCCMAWESYPLPSVFLPHDRPEDRVHGFLCEAVPGALGEADDDSEGELGPGVADLGLERIGSAEDAVAGLGWGGTPVFEEFGEF